MVHTIFGVIVNEVLPFPMVLDFLGAFRRPAFGPHRAPLLHSHPTLRHHHPQGVDGEEEKGGVLQTADTTLSDLKNVERNHSTKIVHCKLASKREYKLWVIISTIQVLCVCLFCCSFALEN